MKCLLSILAIFAVASVAAAGPSWSNSVTTTSVKIVPDQNVRSAQAWVGATNTYAQGEIVKNDGIFYMAVVGGISTNLAPVHGIGVPDVQRDGVTWRSFSPQKRNGFIISNHSTNNVYVGLEYDAVIGGAIKIVPNGAAGINGDACPQGGIYCISESGTSAVGSVVW